MVLIGLLLGLCVGFPLGMGIATMRMRNLEHERAIEADARLQGQIDSLKSNVRPTLKPPSNYFGRDD
jgi:hypothetical protein